MQFTDTGHPFYKPLWRRVLIVMVVAVWTAYEFLVSKEALWMTLSAGMLAYAVWVFLIGWKNDENAGK